MKDLSIKIAIVEPAVIIRSGLSVALKRIQGIHIQTFEISTYDLLANYIKIHKPDILVLDIRMPGENGLDILENIKKSNKHIKVLIVTNYPNDQYKNIALKYGADYFLNKSTEFEKIPLILTKLSNEKINNVIIYN